MYIWIFTNVRIVKPFSLFKKERKKERKKEERKKARMNEENT